MIYQQLKRIRDKIIKEGSQEPYQTLLDKFVVLCTYENVYLMQKLDFPVRLQKNGSDMFLNCGGFGILIDENDKISIHT